MQFEESILIDAPADSVYERAADLEAYSDLADEYRESKVLSRDDAGAVVERKARIAGLPFTWRSNAAFVPPHSIEFCQISGPLRGMRTLWQIAPEPEGTRLSIVHDLTVGPRPVGNALAGVVYRLFVKKLALKILTSLKASLEAADTQDANHRTPY